MNEAGSIIVRWVVFYAAWYVMNVIGYRKQFEKAGINKGIAFVPFLREVKVYQMSWDKKNMGLYWLIGNIGGIILTFVGAAAQIQIVGWIGVILVVYSQVLQIIRTFKQAKAFNRGGGTVAGLIFLDPIWNIVIGQSTSEYRGAVK